MSNSRLSSRKLVLPEPNAEKEHLIKRGRVAEKHRFVVDAPLRNSAIAVVKKKFSTQEPELARRLCAHLEKMNKLKKYSLIELVLKEYNMTIIFSTLDNSKDKEEMTYTLDNLDYDPPAELKRKGFLGNLFE